LAERWHEFRVAIAARSSDSSASCPDIRSHKDTAKIGAWSVMQISALSDLSV